MTAGPGTNDLWGVSIQTRLDFDLSVHSATDEPKPEDALVIPHHQTERLAFVLPHVILALM